jgi:thioredoxin 1
MIKMVEINDSQFDSLVLKSALPVLLECASPECIICKTMTDRIQEVAKDYASKMVYLRLNINDNKRWQEFNVRVIPTLLYFKDGILVARQDNFPEIGDIRDQIKLITGKEGVFVNANTEIKTAVDLEYVAAKFYKYVYTNTKNGQVKESFRLIHQESLAHRELLEVKLNELTGEKYAPAASSKFEGLEMKPQSFSLLGAIKMAIKIEEKLRSFYKKLWEEKFVPGRDLFKKLVKEKGLHLKKLQAELKFMQEKELLGPMESPEYATWLNKVFE